MSSDHQSEKYSSDLFSGEIIARHSPRMQAMGDVDELNSVLGLVRYYISDVHFKDQLLNIQKSLIVIGAELAVGHPDKVDALEKRIGADQVQNIIEWIQSLKDSVSAPSDFLISGEVLTAAHCHHARTVARRCERSCSVLWADQQLTNDYLMQWLNRLGAYLFWLAVNQEQDCS